MFNLSPLASMFAVIAFAGFGICVIHVLLRQWTLMRDHRLNPFSFRNAADVMNGAYGAPGGSGLFQRRHGKLALALMVIGFFGAMAVIILEIVTAPRP